ncbi:hypothetical protein AUI46_02335 [archaeon 13_1_40CM_2_52_13]|nr:MAG: hypothetical protein AUI46_02335 [archaeon 13_1_40CM_2_52_13]OLE71436.1 MAG: hypothetical protein AUF78_02245 [archaeon 13_1_20CM_2_51_12]TMI40775.1 MAG: hypothetical protein E6H21_05615 [Candidatus Bathyarchaeota archaeon]
MGFLSIMGKILIGLAMLTLPVAVSLILVFSEALTTLGVAISLGASVFVFFCGVYAGFLGIKYERLHQRFESFVDPVRIRQNAVNMIKAVCPIDHEQVVFVHVSPHRDDARPDGLDIFLGSCGHEVHRGEIEVEQPAEPAAS